MSGAPSQWWSGRTAPAAAGFCCALGVNSFSNKGLTIGMLAGLVGILSGGTVLADPPAPAEPPPAATQSVDPSAKKLTAADGLLQRKLFKLAADEYDQFLKDYPDNPQVTSARYGLAICRYRLGQFDAAEPLLRQVLSDQTFAQADEALSLLGYCELTGKQYSQAIGHFDDLIARFPNSAQADPARLYRAQALYLSGKPKDAAAAAGAYLQKHTKGSDVASALYFLALSDRAINQNEQALAALDRLTHDFPDSQYQFDAVLLTGEVLQANGKIDAAIVCFRRLAAGAPDARKADAHYTLGVALFKAGKLVEAAAELAAAADDPVNHAYVSTAKMQLGMVDLGLGKIAEARVIFSAIANDDPGEAQDASYGLGQCDLAEKKYASAQAIFDQLLQLQPPPANRPQIALYRAICLMQQNLFEQAAREFDALADAQPGTPLAAEALYRSAYCFHAMANYAASLDRCQRVAKLPESPMSGAAAELGAEDLFLLQKYAEAHHAFDLLIARAGDEQHRLSLRLRAAQCDYFAGNFAAAVTELQPLADDPRTAQTAELRQAIFLLGDSQLQLGRNDAAEAALKKFASSGGSDTREAQYKLSVAELRQGENEPATRQLEALASQPADSPWVQRGLLALAQIRYKAQNAEGAGELLKKLLAVSPAPDLAGSALYLQGWLDFDAKRFHYAEVAWGKMHDQYPNHPLASDAAYQRGVALQQANEDDDAVTAYLAFADAYPKSANAAKARQAAAAILSAQSKNEQALKLLVQLGGDPSASDSILYDLAWAQRKMSHAAAAQEAYRRIISQYPGGPFAMLARTELGELLYNDKNYAQAAAMLWPVVSANAGDAKVLAAAGYRLAWCYQKSGDFDKAAGSFRDFASKFPDDQMAPSALIQAALADADAGRDEQAQKELSAMLDKYPQHADAPVAMLKLADVQAAQNDFAGSQQTAQRFLAKFPNHALGYRAQFCIGWALENQKKFEPARTAYQQVIAASNGETAARAQFQIGETYLAEQKFEPAIPAFLAVEDVYAYPQWSARALLEAGRTFEQLKQLDQARTQYAQLVSKYKSTPEAEMASARLKSIGGS